MDCIHIQNITNVSQQLVQSWPMLTPFAVISMDLWSPGNTVSHISSKYILNSMCNVTTLIVSVAVKNVNASKLTRSFMDNVLLNL